MSLDIKALVYLPQNNKPREGITSESDTKGT